MAYFNELPFYKTTYDLLLEMFRFTKDFTKEYKYTVGESLKKETIELIILIYRLNSKDLNWKGFVKNNLIGWWLNYIKIKNEYGWQTFESRLNSRSFRLR